MSGEITQFQREVADAFFGSPQIVRLNHKKLGHSRLLCDLYVDWLARMSVREPQLTTKDVLTFTDDGAVIFDDVVIGAIEPRTSGLWHFRMVRPDGKDHILPGFYPTYAIAEVGVRAYLEHQDEPEIGMSHHDGR